MGGPATRSAAPAAAASLRGLAADGCATLAIAVCALAAGVAPASAVLVACVGGMVAAVVRRVVAPSPETAPEVAPKAREALQVEATREDVARLLALELAHDRVQSVLSSLREGVVVVDFAGEIVLANPAARLVLGETAPAGRMLGEIVPDGLRVHVVEALEQLRVGGNRQLRYSAIPAGDRVFDVTAARVRSEQSGEEFGSVFLFVDSTHSHELVRLKDRFLSTVSHELRTPLTNICAYTEILNQMQPGESAEWPDFLAIVHDESLQLSQLVDNLFDYLQLESGEAKFDPIDVDPLDIVRGEVGRARETVDRRDLRVALELVVEATPPRIVVDTRRFHQVCRQLLDNALKFTPAGGTVHVVVGRTKDEFCLRVEDSGPGVPVAERFAVFEKFSQLRDHLTEKPPGTGLGLATARLIVSALGGLIWCDESPLGGAAFSVLLPAAGSASLVPGRGEAAHEAAAPPLAAAGAALDPVAGAAR